MNPTPPRAAYTAPPGHLARRIHLPRCIGLGLGGISVGGALLQAQAAQWMWLALAFNALVWPHLARWVALRNARPDDAERRNLILDAALGGFWVAAMGGNVLPSVLIATMLAMNGVAVGGLGLLGWSLAAQFAVGVASWLVLQPTFVVLPDTATLFAALPFAIVYPLTIGAISYRLAVQLSRKRKAFAESERFYRETFDAMDAGVVLFDEDDRLVLCNQHFRALYRGASDGFLVGMTFRQMLQRVVDAGLIPEAAGCEREWIEARCARHGVPASPMNRPMRDGTWRRIIEQRLSAGGILGFSTDVTELIASQQALAEANGRLEKMSETDSLTGLANRRLFDRRIEEECHRASRHAVPMALLLVDVDHFKRINDLQGHLAGDACLREVAQALAGCPVRSSDLVARYGGEEFALLLPHTTRAEAIEVALRCLARVDALAIDHPKSELGPSVTVSVGVAAIESSFDALSPQSLIAAADTALYQAKAEGRHRVVGAAP
jgi:diguanylate cyclase (GGDEF)-like protein